MSDPIETAIRGLAGQEPPGGFASADAVRRRGVRRTYRQLVSAGVAVLATAGGVVTWVESQTDRRAPQVTTSPTPSPTPTLSPTSTLSPTPTPSPPPASLKCEVARLASPRPSETPTGVAAVDPSGRYIVGAYEQGASKNTAVVLWTDGAPQTFTAGSNPIPHAVNAAGTVVGQARRNGVEAAWSYQNGRTSFLTVPKGATGTFAFAINARGDVAGEAKFPGDKSSAVVWPASTPGTVKVLAADTKWAKASGITDDGTVVGDLGDGDQPYLWRPDGRGEALAVPGGQTKGKAFGVQGDWAFGWAGMASSGGGEVQWARWNLRTGIVELLHDFSPSGIAADGTVSGTAGAMPFGGEPALWRDGTIVKLPRLRPELTGADILSISADGKVVAGSVASTAGGQREPAVWHC
jgi:uncharacterized membrane protein